MLLENGADPNITNEFNRTALEEAMLNEKEDVVVLILLKAQNYLLLKTEIISKKEKQEIIEEQIEEEEQKKTYNTKDEDSIQQLEDELSKHIRNIDPNAKVNVNSLPINKQ